MKNAVSYDRQKKIINKKMKRKNNFEANENRTRTFLLDIKTFFYCIIQSCLEFTKFLWDSQWLKLENLIWTWNETIHELGIFHGIQIGFSASASLNLADLSELLFDPPLTDL